MDIEGLGDVLVETLVDKGMVKDVADHLHADRRGHRKPRTKGAKSPAPN